MPKKNPTVTEIAAAFWDPSTLVMAGASEVRPSDDLAFCVSDRQPYRYEGGAWYPVPDDDPATGEASCMVASFLADAFPDANPTTSLVRESLVAILRSCRRRFSFDSPPPYLVLADATLDLSDATDQRLVPHSRDHYALFSLPFASSSLSTPTPAFDAYLSDALPTDEERSLFLMALGYYLVPYDREPAFFYLYGPPRTGKSVAVSLFHDIFGGRYCSSFSLQSLTTSPQTVAELSGKMVNVLDEDESERISSDRFKALVDHSVVEARRLYQRPFSFRPFAKFLASSNQLPAFRYVEGIERRIRMLHFRSVVPVERQDKSLREKLRAEVPGIVGKALAAASVLAGNNWEFPLPEASRACRDEFVRMVMPAALFVAERCDIAPTDDAPSWTPNEDLYDAYRGWCERSGHKPASSQTFHRQLASVPGVRVRVANGERRKSLLLRPPRHETATQLAAHYSKPS